MNTKKLIFTIFCFIFIFGTNNALASLTLDSTSITTDSVISLSGGNVGIGTATPTAKLEIQGNGPQLLLTGGTLATDGTESWLKVTGTFPATTGLLSGVSINLTTSAGTNGGQWGLQSNLNAGYTGALSTIGVLGGTSAASTGTDLRISTDGGIPFVNMGFYGQAKGTTTGTNVGTFSHAGNGNLNIALAGKAVVSKDSATNIGVMGVALNGAVTAPVQIGGYFGLRNTTPTTPVTLESAALIADNGINTSPIFLGKDNGATVFSIIDTGKVGVGTAAPTELFDINSNNLRVRTAKTPASATDTCDQGEIAWDASFIYVCIATNTWQRSATTTW